MVAGCRKAEPNPAEMVSEAAPSVAPALPPLRRLVSSDINESARNFLDLTSANLGGEASSIELLEREQIERVLAEHKLTLGGRVDAKQVVAVGKVLSVDLFAVVETTAERKDAIGLVVFDARSGARLWDVALPAGGAKPAAQSAADGVRQAARKYHADLKALQPLCLLSVRNADLPADKDSLCQSLALILERKLLGSASVIVLERKRLEQMNQERSLPGQGRGMDLMKATHFLELEVSRAREGAGVQAHVFLTDSEGKRQGDVIARAEASHAAGLCAPLLQGVLEKLRARPRCRGRPGPRKRPIPPRDPAPLGPPPLDASPQAAEAAHALDADDAGARAALAENLLHYAVYQIDPKGLNVLTWEADTRSPLRRRAPAALQRDSRTRPSTGGTLPGRPP